MENLEPLVVDEMGASRLTTISVSSLQKMRVRGEGPRYLKIGTRVRYRVADLDAWLESYNGA